MHEQPSAVHAWRLYEYIKMSTPRFYSWDDDGSPGRALTGNLQNKLKQILVPCLVTGYGDKPGAGWTVGHEHANGFSLINADGNVVNFVSNLPAQAPYPAMRPEAIHVYAAESLTRTSEAIIDGANLCSGTFRKGFVELSGYARHSYPYASFVLDNQLPSLQWTLVADDKTFTLSCSTAGSNNDPTYSFNVHAGEVILDAYIPGSFVVLGGSIPSFAALEPMFAYSVGYTSPMDLSTGLLLFTQVGAEPYRSESALNKTNKSGRAPARINLQQPRLLCGNEFVGRLRGVVYDDVIRHEYGWEEHLKVLGFSGTNFTDRGKLVLLDGYNYAFARSNSGNSILTDNPAFW